MIISCGRFAARHNGRIEALEARIATALSFATSTVS
jgi:hypothetical protein